MDVFEVKHRVAHSAQDMYALVARVEDYPKFLPLVETLEVTRREEVDGNAVLITTMQVGYKLIRERFTTKVTLDDENHTILVEYLDGPFAHLENRWRFLPQSDGTSEVDFFIAYSFRSRMFERLIGGLFAKAVRKYTHAFETRADEVYGRKTKALASHQ
jgi:coenzyme Q-binding protein COQ10